MVKTKPLASPASPLVEWGLIGRVGFGCFLLALVLPPLIGGFPSGAVYQNDTALNALRGLVILAAACLLVSPPPPTPPDAVKPFTVPIASFVPRIAVGAMWAVFGWTFLSLLVHSRFLTSPVLLFAMLPATLDWLVYALVFWLAARLARRRELLPFFAIALTVSAGIAAGLLVREYGQFAQAGMKGQRAQAPFFSPNFAAGFFALALPVVVLFFLSQKERLAVLSVGVVAALMVGALAATGSRAGIALAVLGVGIALFLAAVSRKNGLRLFSWARLGVLVLVFGMMAFGFRGPLTARVESGSAAQEHSGDFRKETVRGALDMVQANPVWGTGPGTFPYRYAPYARVARTDLAHHSYVQAVAEQGLPALLAPLTVLFTLIISGPMRLGVFRRSPAEQSEAEPSLPRLLLCGLIGGVLAGFGRSYFDSEWSLLGNGLPFWCLTGAITGMAALPSLGANTTANEKHKPWASSLRFVGAAALLVPLVLCVMLLQTATVRDSLTAARRPLSPADLPNAWPPDPQILYLGGQLEDAARTEPSGKRWYQLGLRYGREGGSEHDKRAADAFQKSVGADPTNLQAWRRLAEARQKVGDEPGAQTAWHELITRHEGPIGQIRAIPELTELHPAFAYAALGRAAQKASEASDARVLYEKAAGVIERYSQTAPTYQQVEVQSAQSMGVDLAARRREARDLYEQVITDWDGLMPNSVEKAKLMQRKTDTLARFDALSPPVNNDASAQKQEPR